MRSGRLVKVMTLVTLLSFAVGATGCYGSFNLLRTVYKFNGDIKASDDKKVNGVIQSLVMVVLWIVPVYGIATLADALVVNTVEFWTGKNPVKVDAEPVIRTVERGENRYVQAFSRTAAGKEMRIEHYRQGGLASTFVVRQEENSPTVTGDLSRRDGRHEVYQVTYAGEETYILGHTNAAGEHSQRIASRAEVKSLESRVEKLLAARGTPLQAERAASTVSTTMLSR